MFHRYYCTRCTNIQTFRKGVQCRHCGGLCRDVVVEVDRTTMMKRRNNMIYSLFVLFTSLVVAGYIFGHFDPFSTNVNIIDFLPLFILSIIVINSFAVILSFSSYYYELKGQIEANVASAARQVYGEIDHPFTFKPITKEIKKMRKLREKGAISRDEFQRRKEKLLKHWEDYLGYTNVRISVSEEGYLTLVPAGGE